MQVAADHYRFVAKVGAGQLREHVIGIAVFGIVIFRLQVDAELHRDVLFDHERDHVVMLRTQRHRGNRARAAIAAGYEHGAVLTAAGFQDHARAGFPNGLRDTLRGSRSASPASGAAPSDAGCVGGGHRDVSRIARLRAIFADEVGHDRLGHDDRAF
jgi:hypothetical protein